MSAVLLWIINVIAVSSGHPISMAPLAIGTIIISLGATAFGIINATMPRIVTYEVNSPSLREKWSGKNIVIVSDTHLGVSPQWQLYEKSRE